MSVRILPLGAGQDVGRSCIILSIENVNVMLDCGMHMGYHDDRRFPKFSQISKTLSFDDTIDCVIVTHFHLDHCGALPFFTEKQGYSGPIYMTEPTKAICPILLDDMSKIMERKGQPPFTLSDIEKSMAKVIPVNLLEPIKVKENLEIQAYYAGHVLGAAMFKIKVGEIVVVYTGDYNMTPDRHLGAAWIDHCEPDVLITESTYATTIRDSKRAREREFLTKIHKCVNEGGKVLIPVFALGRAQELCILLDGYWERMKLNVPIFFSAGLTEKANEYYKMYIDWTNESIMKTAQEGHNMFDYKHIEPFSMNYVNNPGPMVVFASPGMLHVGTSLDVFRRWCHDPKNMIILPGYCVAGTVGAKVLAGEKEIQLDTWTQVQVNMQVENLSFSAHVDAKGIAQLIKTSGAKNVVLVHGEKGKMHYLKKRIEADLKIPCFCPPNNSNFTIKLPYLQQSSHVLSLDSHIKKHQNFEFLRNLYKQKAMDAIN